MAWGGNQFTPLLAMYRNLEGYSATQVNLFLAMYVVALIPGFVLVGPVSRRFGRRSVAAVGLLTGAIASVVLAVGPGSPVALCAGRFLVGASVAVAMVVGTTWIDELTGRAAPRGVAARRAAGTLTLGFAAGAATAGVLAQWGPQPRVTPYVVHLVLSAMAGVLLVGSSDTLPPARREPDARPEVRLPVRARRRFVLVVLPTAPWVFAAAGLAYAIVPELVVTRTGDHAVAFATLLTVTMLGSGAVTQRVVPRLARWTRGRDAVVGMALMTLGCLLVVVQVSARSLVLAVAAAAVLGVAYGITIVAGLVEVRQMAAEEALPGLTGVYYALTYVGFGLPVVLAAGRPLVDYQWSLSAVAAACLVCTLLTAHGLRTASEPEPGLRPAGSPGSRRPRP